jgi:UDP-glucose 4-epimerase
MFLRNKIIAVCGSSGFIAGHLIEALEKEKPKKIIPLDIETGQDILDFKHTVWIFKKEKPDIIFNLAVLPLPASLVEPHPTVVKILYMMINLCEMCRLKLFKRLVHISSSEAYGNAMFRPQSENHPLNPRTPYASSKASCDLIALSYHKTFGIDVVIPRCFNTYGPGQPLKWGALIPKVINTILQGGKPIIFKNGKRTRDFIYVTDTAKGIIGVAKHAKAGEVVNIGSGVETTVMDMLLKICKMMESKSKFDFQVQRPGDVSQLICDNRKAREMFGFKPEVKLEDGLRRTIDYYTDLHYSKTIRS